MRSRVSVAGRLTAGFLLVLLLMAGGAAAATTLDLGPGIVFLLVLVIGLPVGAWLIGRMLAPMERVLSAVSDGIRSFRDRDFSVRIASDRKDELGDLARLYNEVSQTLLDERRQVREQELLLQTALNRSPAAIVLINQIDRVIYSNRTARRLLSGGSKLEGRHFEKILAGCPPRMREILESDGDGIFTVQGDDDQLDTYHLAQRVFHLNRRRHELILLRRLTGELTRQEVEIWKKVIRVISHELNNSLAPISSLVHSVEQVAGDPAQSERAAEIFAAIEERIDHLKRFLEGYARFARLPRPQKQAVDWSEFLSHLGEVPSLQIVGSVPSTPGYFDPAQLRQVLINLFKNAVEASNGNPDITMRIDSTADGGTFLQVSDRGRGMDEETMEKALLPFYSTKQTGSGLGLPLCREILEAHGGKISLQSNEGGGTIVTCWLPPG